MRRCHQLSHWAQVIAWLVILACLFALAGCGGGSHKTSSKTLPRPALPAGVTAPSCTGLNHDMGQCLPKASGTVSPHQLSIPRGITCIDLSNNDPVFGVSRWRTIRARGIRCADFKVNESTGFIDRTAAQMARDAKAAGLVVGGYDFQHVCGPSAVSEAHLFSTLLRADGLLGPGTMDPAADVEAGNGSCGARSWELQWRAQVRRETGRNPQTYTGAWFWNPTFGAFDPGGYKWVSGYRVSWPFMPSGWHLDQWQWADNGFNGISSADMSVWLDGESAFARFASAIPAPPKGPVQLTVLLSTTFPTPWGRVNERTTGAQFLGAIAHRAKYRGYLRGLLHAKLAFLAGRIAHVAIVDHRGWHGSDRGPRYQFLLHDAAKAAGA